MRTSGRQRARRLALRLALVSLVTVTALVPGAHGARAESAASAVPPQSDPKAATYCLSREGLSGMPQTVQGVSVVAVCVDNYQYVPGDDDAAPCPGYVGDTPLSTCANAASIPAPKLEVAHGSQLLFVVPDPNMHTLTSVGCPNVYEDPASPDPVGAFNLAVTSAEQGLFGPDAIDAKRGRCRFDSYPENGGTVPATPGTGALMGPGYETVDTSHLPPGTYKFYCQVHAFMRGTLVIDPPRPRKPAAS